MGADEPRLNVCDIICVHLCPFVATIPLSVFSVFSVFSVAEHIFGCGEDAKILSGVFNFKSRFIAQHSPPVGRFLR